MWNVFHKSRHEGGVDLRLVRTIVTPRVSGCPTAAPKCPALFNRRFADKLFSLFFDLGYTSPSQHNRVRSDV